MQLNDSDDAMDLQDIGFRFPDDVIVPLHNIKAPTITLIPLKSFEIYGSIPRYPNQRSFCLNSTVIDRNSSFIVFVSHTWLRENDETLVDNQTKQKHKLCVKGIKNLWKKQAPKMENCYIWMDFGCLNQDEPLEPQINQLEEIMKLCDCIFTPLLEKDVNKAFASSNKHPYFNVYKSFAWSDQSYINGYINRAWCRLEMFYAANIPTENDKSRLRKFASDLYSNAARGIRPHYVYGTRELLHAVPPKMIPPIQNMWFQELDPRRGQLSFEADRKLIKNFVAQLQPYLKRSFPGYKGRRNLFYFKHGVGTLVTRKGNIYEGQWYWGFPHGSVREEMSNGDVYEGDYFFGRRHGIGCYTWSNGNIYEGQFYQGVRDGKGILRYFDGSVYEGNFEQGLRHGRGIHRFADGMIYDGDWQYDNSHGEGTIYYANGDEFEGTFKKGYKHGRGVMRYKNGRVILGQWRNNTLYTVAEDYGDGNDEE